jgi:hypothetical protein
MPILLEDLIKQLPSDTEKRVSASKDRFRARIREALRTETRLTLYRSGEDRDGSDSGFSLQVAVLPGVPGSLLPHERQAIDEQYQLAILLSPYRGGLTQLRDSGQLVSQELLPKLQVDLAKPLLDGRHSHIKPAWQYAEFLLNLINEFDLTKHILRVNEDVLGRYCFRVDTWDDPQPRIELYWGVIGLVARDLQLDPEDLTCVVLAHEMAHAYTHLGFDIDGERWASVHFNESELPLVEGLAQHYTMLACKRLASIAPSALEAYRKLLPKQPPAYRVQADWENEFTSEHIRLAMLETRRSSRYGRYREFIDMLVSARHQLRGAAKRASSTGRLDI